MKKLILTSLFVSFSFLFFSCSSKTSSYSLNLETQMVLKKYSEKTNKKIAVRVSGKDTKSMTCRLTRKITPPEGKTYLEYIKDALIKELALQDIYDASSRNIVEINVKELKFDSVLGKWIINSDVVLPNGKSFELNEVYEFGFGYIGEESCNKVTETYPKLVQNYIKSLVTNKNFAEYLNDK